MNIRAFEALPSLRTDPERISASVALLGQQLRAGWDAAGPVFLPPLFLRVESVAICGMGGSHLAPDILRSVLGGVVSVPIAIVADYSLPHWVNDRTLVVASSYSGTTEEVKTMTKEAEARHAKVLVLTTGGPLAHMAKRDHLPFILLPADTNPSNQPRLGLGLGLGALLRVWSSLGWIKAGEDTIAKLITTAESAARRYGPTTPAVKNLAKKLGLAMAEMMPLLLGAEWTGGNLHTWTNQIHENAKTFASWDMLPDANHHLLEGLRHKRFNHQIHAVYVMDKAYHPRIKRRFAITQELLSRAGVAGTVVEPHGATELEKALDLLVFGSYVSWYMALARHVASAPIPTVDELKKRLAKG